MPRYRKLGYVALNVGDLARARTFYENELGLEASGEGSGAHFFRCGFEHHAVALYPARQPGLKRVGLELAGDVAEAARELAAAGLDVTELERRECEALHIDRAFRIVEPFTGATFEFYGAMRELAAPYLPRLAKIQRIGHVVLKVPELEAACDFYTRVLGFRVSDMIDGQACFMRCHPSPYHHGVALIKAREAQLHHVNFMVREKLFN
jgi:2,3-dihydroxy-p-cumate/2,3-dihydroxybenzoate 3,4-dioxygenase